jgi:hypothetical protein
MAHPPEVHLSVALLRCNIKVAYQAADAGHPERGRASSPLSKQFSPYSSFLTKLHATKAHIGRASPEKSTSRTVSILSIGWSPGKASAYKAVFAFSQSLKCRATEADPVWLVRRCPRQSGFYVWALKAAAWTECCWLRGRCGYARNA